MLDTPKPGQDFIAERLAKLEAKKKPLQELSGLKKGLEMAGVRGRVKKTRGRLEAIAKKREQETVAALTDIDKTLNEINSAPSSELIVSGKRTKVAGEFNAKPAVDNTGADYESLEIIEDALSEDAKKELDDIIDVFHRAGAQNEFLEHVLKKSNFILSQEKVAADPVIRKYLEENFKQQGEFGSKLEDFIFMLPTEQDFVEHAAGNKRRTAEMGRHLVIPAVSNPEPASELIPEETTQRMAENLEAHKNDKYIKKTVELFLEQDSATFKQLMLEGDAVHYALNKEDASKDAFAAVLLKYLIENGMGKKELAALVESLPSKQEYNTSGWQAEARVKVKRISDEFKAQRDASEEMDTHQIFKQAQAAYVEAYKKFDPKFTEGKPHALIAVSRPPLFAFSSTAKELKSLFRALNIARKNAESEDDEENIRKNLAGVRAKTPVNKEGLSAEARSVLKKSAEEEEKAGAVKQFYGEEDWYGPKEQVLVPIHERVAASKNILEDTGEMLKERGRGIDGLVKEIEAFFSKKYGIKQNYTRKFLLGAEIKGLFKGDQRRRQEEYKGYFKNELYQKFLKENPGR